MTPYKGKVTVEKTIKYLQEELNYAVYNNDINISLLKFRFSEEEISEILFKYQRNNVPISNLSMVVHLSEILNITLTSKENRNILDNVIEIYMDKHEKMFPKKELIDKLFSSFNDKKICVEYLRYVYSKETNNPEALNSLIEYLIKARQYYVDDRALFSSVINLIDSIEESDFMFGHMEKINKQIEKKLLDDKKSNGIYDIDQTTLEELDKKLNEFELVTSKLENLIKITDQQIEELKKTTKDSKEDFINIKINTLKDLKEKANKVLSEFDALYLEMLNKERENLIGQKDLLIADIDTYFNKKKLELEVIASNIGQRIAIELGRIRNASELSIDQMKEFISNNEEVKRMFNVAKEDQAFLNALSKLDSIPVSEVTASNQVEAKPIIGVPSIVIPQQEHKVMEKVNYYFNKEIPFKDRFQELMQKKEEDIEKNGAIYHSKFDDLVIILLKDGAPYIYGPSGCGKTYMFEKQLAKLLGINMITNSFIMYETDILGFNNANGIYVPSNLYRCYKYGGTLFIDEFDNSKPKSAIILNSFIGKGEDSSYTFPNGELVNKHPNFRIVAAGNTRGTGRTVLYNTREKQDASVMERFKPIEVSYDNQIEKIILKDYDDWYNFLINFRKSLNAIKKDGIEGINYDGIITTKNVEEIKQYKDDGCFSDEKIIEYEVIKNKEIDYLNEIIQGMESLTFNDGGLKLFKKFKVMCKNRRY